MAAEKIKLSTDELQHVRNVIVNAGLTDTTGRYPEGHAHALLGDTPPLNA